MKWPLWMKIPESFNLVSGKRSRTMEAIIGLLALTAMEIVLGIDNVVFIAILASKLPKEQQAKARNTGLLVAMVSRILLLLTLTWILKLTAPVFHWTSLGIPESIIPNEEVSGVSWRDIILLVGGLFLIGKSVREIHEKLEADDHERKVKDTVTFGSVIAQIAVLDIIFSLDSVITAVGMIHEDFLWAMITAIVIAMLVMLVSAKKVSAFVEKHPTVKMLALSFLILIGVMLVAEGVGTHFNKGYVYFAMFFSLVVEMLNLKLRSKRRITPTDEELHQAAH